MTGAAGFPAPIAAAMQAWESETVLFRRQARLIACFESLLQYAAIVAVSEFYAAGLERDFQDVDTLIREVIHRPSTGTWQRLYREAMGAFRDQRAALVADALYLFGFDEAGRQHPRMRDVDKITQLRNEQKGHGHVLADEGEYRAILEKHDVLLRGLLDAATFAGDLTLYVILSRDERGVSAGRLMGPVETAGPVDHLALTSDTPPQGNVGVRHGVTGRWRDLSPLLLYLECEREVERVDARGERTRERCGRPGLFFHHELIPPSRLRGFEFRYGHHSAWRFPEFEFVGRYLERFGRRGGPVREAEWYQARIEEATRFFVGRHEALADLTRIARHGPRRVAFVVAKPGYGKSTLLARWIAQVEGEAEGPRLSVCRHFVQEQYPESGRASNVFDILRHQVCARFGLDPTPPFPDGRPRAERYRTALLQSLALAVAAAEPRLIALVIDGLDEALRTTAGENEALLDWLPGPDLLPRGVSLVLSGRPNVEDKPVFRARFGGGVTDRLELERLSEAEVRQWFELGFGPVYALEHRVFLDRVTGAAKGHPQYLHFVHRALLDGSLQPGDVDRLPAGLEDFYGRVMGEAAGEQPASLRIIALLAAAAAPLDLGTLAAILGERADQVARACDAARNVLEWDPAGRTLLFDAEFASWVREGKVRSPTDALRRETSAAMSARLLEWCLEWQAHRSPYAATNLVAHLVAAGRRDDVTDLARNPEFLRFQSTARPDAPDLPLATFRAALHHAAATVDPAAEVEFGLRRIAWTLATLDESPLDAFATGSLDRARRLADLLDPVERLRQYLLLATELARRDGPQAATTFLGLPGRLPWWTLEGNRPGEEPPDLGPVADAMLGLIGLPGFAALWRLYLDDPARSRLAVGLVGLGHLDEAELVIRKTAVSPPRDAALIALAEKVAAAGEFERAYRFADDMWGTRSRWASRASIASIEEGRRGLAVLESVQREASRDPGARDALVHGIAIAYAGAGKFDQAALAARRIERVSTRDETLDAIAVAALDQGRIATATGFIAGITTDPARRRSLLDRAGLAALWPPRPGDIVRVLVADPSGTRLGWSLAALTAAIALGMALLAAVPGWSGVTPWGSVAWIAGAFALIAGFRAGSIRAGGFALAWSALASFAMRALSDAGPLPVAGALLAGGVTLLFTTAGLGLDRARSTLGGRAITVALTALIVAGLLSWTAGPALIRWTFGSAWVAFALLLPTGAAFGASAVATVSSAEERLTYHAAAIVPALVLVALGNPDAAGMPVLLMFGWGTAGLLSVTRPVLQWLRIPGRQALFLVAAEAGRALWAGTDVARSAKPEEVSGAVVAMIALILWVAIMRRRENQAAPAAEPPPAEPIPRVRRSLADLRKNAAQHAARARAELLLRLARLFPPGGTPIGRSACGEAATAATAIDDSKVLEEPMRRDLLWQIAREAWRQRDLAGATRAAWLVEWRPWSGLLAVVSSIATGSVLGAIVRWFVSGLTPNPGPTTAWIIVGVGSLVAMLAAVVYLRTLRESMLALPLAMLAAVWLIRGGEAVQLIQLIQLIAPVVLVLLLLSAVGATRSGSVGGWAAALGQAWRWQVVLALPVSLFIAALAAWILGAPWATAWHLFWRPTWITLVLALVSLSADTALTPAARRILPRHARDLPPLASATPSFEQGVFAEEVGAAVVRLAERTPDALTGIVAAAIRVR